MPLAFIQLNLLTLQSFIQFLRVLIEFIVIWVIIYYILKIVRNNSRTVQIFKGIVVVIAMRFAANYLGLKTLTTLLDFFIQSGILLVVIIFQPEIRGMLERLGKTSVFSALHSLSRNEKEQLIDELVKASTVLSKRRIGALITLEQGHSLADFIKTGTPIHSTVTADLLTSIFVTSTPLHDGAVILQGDRIACASAYFPPTNIELPTQYGARHRAAIGISEITDSITIVVSEETGTISIAEGGKLREVDENELRNYLNLILQNVEKEVSESFGVRKNRKLTFGRINVDPIKVEHVDASEIIIKAQKKQEKGEFTKLVSIFKKKRVDGSKKSNQDENKKQEDPKETKPEDPSKDVKEGGSDESES